MRLIRVAWRYPIVALGLALVLFLGYRGDEKYYVTKPPPPSVPHFDMVAPIPPADAVLSCLQGQQHFDTKTRWESYSPLIQSQNLQQGNTLQTMQSTVQEMQQQGLSFGESKYVGGYRLANGPADYFYVTKVKAPGASAEVFQTSFVESDGKILQVDAPQLASE